MHLRVYVCIEMWGSTDLLPDSDNPGPVPTTTTPALATQATTTVAGLGVTPEVLLAPLKIVPILSQLYASFLLFSDMFLGVLRCELK